MIFCYITGTYCKSPSMASGGAFGGARGLQPVAPEKGVFPLDHFQQCKEVWFFSYFYHSVSVSLLLLQ